MELFYDLFGNVLNFTWQQLVMLAIGCVLILVLIVKPTGLLGKKISEKV